MIYITENHDSGEVHKRKYPEGTPETTDRTFTVRQCACFWEVRCVSRAHERVVFDQLVCVLPTEQEAETAAREMSDPDFKQRAGKRVLEELIEEYKDAG